MLFVLDFFDRDVFLLINQRWASPSLDPMMIFLSSKWAFVPLYVLFLGLFVLFGFSGSCFCFFLVYLFMCLLNYLLYNKFFKFLIALV